MKTAYLNQSEKVKAVEYDTAQDVKFIAHEDSGKYFQFMNRFKDGTARNSRWRTFPEYQGWANSMTCIFWMYFQQEQGLMQDLLNLRRVTQKGTINPDRAVKLFHNALMYGHMTPPDDWCQGPVDVLAILQHVYDCNAFLPA